VGLPWGGNGMVRKGYRGGDGSGADGGDDGGNDGDDNGACNAKSAYPAPMIRPVRIAALALLPVLPIALIAGCSHSKPSDDPSATAEATDSSGTPDPTSVPSVATPASPSPAATESEPAATEDSNESNESEDQGGDELPAQGLDQAAALDDGLAVQIGALRATDLEAGPGEIGGSGIVVPVTVGNSTGSDLSLSGLVVTLTYGADAVPASPVDSASDAVPASIAPGDAVVLEYGFVVPVDQRGSVSVVVDSGAGSRAAVFQGEAPTS